MQIQIVEADEIHSQAIALLKKAGHKVLIGKLPEASKKNVEVIFIRTYTQADSNFLKSYPNLKYLLRAGVGLDNIDLDYCNNQKITVLNSPGANANAVAEMVVAQMIFLLRHFSEQSSLLYQKKWRNRKYIGTEISGKTIGLVGCGAIGRLVANKLANFQVKTILGYDPFLGKEDLMKSQIMKVELKAVIQQADLISLHLPLNKQTANLFTLAQFKLMKQSSYIINTSRGGIINETDLIDALKKGIISGAALDVFENEPHPRPELLELRNVILTPHLAGFTNEADKEMSLIPARRFLALTE